MPDYMQPIYDPQLHQDQRDYDEAAADAGANALALLEEILQFSERNNKALRNLPETSYASLRALLWHAREILDSRPRWE